jgi:hypothetical protein
MANRNYYDEADQAAQAAAIYGGIPFAGEGIVAGQNARIQNALGHKAADIIGDVNLPTFNPGDYGQYSFAGDYDPTMAQGQIVEEDPQLRADQMEALSRLSEGLDASSQTKADAARWAAMNSGNEMASAREGAIRQQAERSGQGSNGMNALMQAQAAQLGANRAQTGTMDAVHQQALERLANQQAMINSAGQVRGQDFGIKQANADTLNKFNMFNTQAGNDAKLRNINAHQTLNNANVDMGNKSLDRNDRNTQQVFNNNMTKAGGQANAVQHMAVGAQGANNMLSQSGKDNTETTKDAIAAAAMMFA